MMAEQTGSCLCGGVRIKAHGQLRGVIFCHCSQCRKQTGLYFAATDIEDSKLEIEGQENVTWYRASSFAQRGFCKVCGSALFWKRDGADKISIMAGLFDQPSGLEPQAHIFVADRGDFYTIADELPQYERSSQDVPVAPE